MLSGLRDQRHRCRVSPCRNSQGLLQFVFIPLLLCSFVSRFQRLLAVSDHGSQSPDLWTSQNPKTRMTTRKIQPMVVPHISTHVNIRMFKSTKNSSMDAMAKQITNTPMRRMNMVLSLLLSIPYAFRLHPAASLFLLQPFAKFIANRNAELYFFPKTSG